MKVLYIHQYFTTLEQSLGTRSYEFAKGLVEEGNQVTMLTSDFNGNYKKNINKKQIDGIDVIYIRNKYSSKMSFIRRIYSFIRFMCISFFVVIKQKDIDIIYATSTPLTVGIIGLFKKRISKKPFVFEVRDLWPELPIAMGILKNKIIIKLLSYFEKKIYSSANHIVALSPGMKEGIIKTNYPEESVTIIPNGCDFDVFFPKQQTIKRQLLPFSDDDFVLLYSGAHGIANGLDYVIDLGIKLKQKNINNIKIVLIGDGGKKNYLQQKVKEHELNNILMLNPVPKKNLVNYLHEADMGMQLLADIRAFQYGTSPNKFFDYIAAGLPVINNYNGWVADLIKEYECGIIDSNRNFDFVVNELLRLNKNRVLLKQMGKQSNILAHDIFDRKKLFTKFNTVLLNQLKNV